MSEVIVDTNVIVVANHQNTNVRENCVDSCIEFLTDVRNQHVVLIDDKDEIRMEYARVLGMGRP